MQWWFANGVAFQIRTLRFGCNISGEHSWSKTCKDRARIGAHVYVTMEHRSWLGIWTLSPWPWASEEGMWESFCCSVTKSCLTLCHPVDCNTPGSSVLYYHPKCAEIHVHWVSDAIQPFHPLLPPFSPALNLSQHQGLVQRAGSSQQVAKVLELQQQHQSIFRVDFL